MHKIHLEENAKTSWEPQRHLNLAMQKVVRAEVIKLLDAGIIYPIFDSKRVSPIHVVPKKARITVIKNKDLGSNEMAQGDKNFGALTQGLIIYLP